jgi:hypothetical protein
LRGATLFVAGPAIGLATSVVVALETSLHDVSVMNHVGFNASDKEDALLRLPPRLPSAA